LAKVEVVRAAIYTRISSDPTGQEVGVDRQLAGCRDLADKLGLNVVTTFSDNDISAFSGKRRPGFEAMLESMRSGGFSSVICWHPDRLYRNLKDLERLIDIADERQVQLRTVNGGELDLGASAGRMVARILGSVARQESEHHAERRREANKARALAGEWCATGSRPFGYTKTGEPLEAEAGMMRRAIRDILSGTSLHAIARQWNESGTLTVRGARWSNLHVRRVLTNPRVAGLRVHCGVVIGPGNWSPIVDETTWRGLCAFLGDRNRKNVVAFERKFMLSGVANCGVSECGNRLYAQHPHGRDRAFVYVCRPTNHLGRNGPALDDFVERIVIGYLEEHGVGRDLRAAENNIDTDALRTERDALLATKGDLATLLRKKVLDMAAVERESVVLQRQIDEIDKQLADAVTISPVAALLAEGDEDLDDLADSEKLIERWKAASPDRKGKVVQSLFEVIVRPTRRGARNLDPDSVDIIWRTAS
jgi:site-specific DNA recombinase